VYGPWVPPIVICDWGEDPKNIYVVVNDLGGSGRLRCTLYTSLGLHQLRYEMGSRPEINMCYG